MIGDLFEVIGQAAQYYPASRNDAAHARRMAAIADEHNEVLQAQFNKAIAALRQKNEIIETQNRQISELQSKHIMARSAAEGLKDKSRALEDALRATCPQHSLLTLVGLDDQNKHVNNATLIYWRKFDEILAKMTGGKADPRKWRTFLTKVVKR